MNANLGRRSAEWGHGRDSGPEAWGTQTSTTTRKRWSALGTFAERREFILETKKHGGYVVGTTNNDP